MISDVCVHVCVGSTCARVHTYVCMCVCGDRGAWMVPVLLTNPLIQADINAIDCN